MNPHNVVVKVGGSLFGQPEFVVRLQTLIESYSKQFAPAHIVLVTGGGPLVESLRAMDRVNAISTNHAHWAAIQLMDVNAGLLQQWWPQLHAIDSVEKLRIRCNEVGVTLFRVEAFLREREPRLAGTRLPTGWQVTSDSIAARIAETLNAPQLILVKAASWNATDWQEAAEVGVVDLFFPRIAAKLRAVRIDTLPEHSVRCVSNDYQRT
ncbi:MAG: hypothetical protein WD851_05260 [Pirellulales bacterium]